MSNLGVFSDKIYSEIWIILSLKNDGNLHKKFYSLSFGNKIFRDSYKSETYFESYEEALDFYNKTPLALRNQISEAYIRIRQYDYYNDEILDDYQRKIK